MNRRHYNCCRISVIIVRAVIGILFGLIKTTYFKLGSIFKTAYKIYKFDSEVRKMVIVEVEKNRDSSPYADCIHPFFTIWRVLV